MQRQDLATAGGAALQALCAGLALTPGTGTPGGPNHGGNSTPVRAPVAGAGKSEQSSEQQGVQ